MRRSVRTALLVTTVVAVAAAIIPVTQALAANGASATFTKQSDWGSGYEGKYTITNGSASPLTWRVEFDLPTGATISSFWDADLTKSANHVVAVGRWNATLAVGASTSFGWIGAPGGVAPSNCRLNGASCDAGGTVDTTPPTTPGTLSSPGKTTTSISLSWGASTDSGGSGLAGYNVYRNGSATPTAQPTGTTFTDTGLTPNTTYTYTVRARDGAGNLSPNSNQISVTTNSSTSDSTPPTTPGTLSSPSKTSASVNLSWGASTDSGGSGLAGYNIYRNGSATPTAQTTGTATTHTDSGLSANTTYTYTVRARDGAGNLSNPSNQISVTTNQATGGANRRIGYFTQWGIYGRNFKVKQVDTTGMAAKLTHINYAFGNVNESGRCFVANQLGVGDAWADYQTRFSAADSVDGVADVFNQPLAGNFNQLKELKAKHPHLKVLMSLGGWTWSRYFSNAALPANRSAFVASCIDLFIKGNLPVFGGEPQGGPGSAFGVFDGIDLDWEWPGSEGNAGNIVRPEDKANFAALVAEFRSQLNAYGASVGRQYLLSAFLPADPAKIDAGIAASVFNHFDYVTVQGYDFYGAWQPQTNHQSQLRSPAANPAPPNQRFSVDSAINKYVSLGAPANKLVVGLPAYGRGWTGVASTNNGLYQSGSPAQGTFEAGIEDYDVLKNRPGTIFRDNTNGAIWKYDGTTFWSYDDPQLIQAKGSYVRGRGLGGLMIWSLDGDDGALISAMQAGLQ
jgi:chitinase